MLNKLAKHHNYWLKILINLGCNLDLAKDIVQEMYIKLHDASNIAYGEDDVNKYYVYKTLKTLYIQHLKDNQKELAEYDDRFDYTEVEYPEERDLAEDVLLGKIRKIASKWNTYDKELFQVYFGVRLDKDNLNIKEGKSMREISNGTDISVGSVFYSIKHIKRQFRDSLREDLLDYFNKDYDRIKTLKYYSEMDLTDKHIRWCWQNNWFVDIVPLDGQNGATYPTVKVELHQRTSNGTRLVQVGDKTFSQKTVNDKIELIKEVNRVYELIYNKYNT